MAELSVIRSVFIVGWWYIGKESRFGISAIRVGNNANPTLNAECVSIDKDGMYSCTSPLKGTHVGITRTSIGNSPDSYYAVGEIRAYTWAPCDESTCTLSANVMPNTSLIDSVHVNIAGAASSTNGAMRHDTLFSTGPAVNSWWMMDLGSKIHVKVVLVYGD